MRANGAERGGVTFIDAFLLPTTTTNTPSMRRVERRWLYTRNTAYVALFCAALLVLQDGFRGGDSYARFPLDEILADAHAPLKTHPIAKYTELAQRRFDAKVKRQSKTLKQAVDEYKRRYNMNPPRGFDKWWEYAQDANFVMVDEFDGLMEDLAPFWNMSGVELARRAKQVRLRYSSRTHIFTKITGCRSPLHGLHCRSGRGGHR